ncbi:hypothetical protein ABMX69_22885, partial [Vibrio vulnificus]
EGFTTLGTFVSTSNLVFMAQCVRLGGGVVHPLIGRYTTRDSMKLKLYKYLPFNDGAKCLLKDGTMKFSSY